MKKWLVSGIVIVLVLIVCSQLWKIKESMKIEGTVLQVNESSVLLSQKDGITSEDLLKTYDEWMVGDYDLISVSNLEDVDVGMILSIVVGEIAESYPAQAQAKSYEVLNPIELSVQEEQEEIVMAPQNPYSQQLLDIFPKTVGMKQMFNGYAEYGHLQTLKTTKLLGSIFELQFDGEMIDGRGDSSQRLFQLTYEITDQAVTEHIHNQDAYNQLDDERLLNSIIPDKVLLKLPLEVGNSWFETFAYQGQEYTATTEIVRIETNDDGKVEYETLTTVKAIEGYYNECYKESRVFTTGSGMTSFSNLFSLAAVGVDYEGSEQSEDLYLFGYYLSNEDIVVE